MIEGRRALRPLVLATFVMAQASCETGEPDSLATTVPGPGRADGGADGAIGPRAHVPGRLGIGVFYQPPPPKPDDVTFADMARFGVDVVMANNTDGFIGVNTQIASACARNGLGLMVLDSRFIGGQAPSPQAIADVVAANSGLPGLVGYYLRDEPPGSLLPAYAAAHAELLRHDPIHTWNYFNLLPTYADDARLIVPRQAAVEQTATGGGDYVTTAVLLSQTFRTAATQHFIDAIELSLDAAQWSPGESVMLQLFDGAALVATRTMAASNNGAAPQFALQTAVQPAHDYRWVLSHGGGGDGSVGLVMHAPADAYANGTASVGGVARPYDFTFRVYEGKADARESAQRAQGAGEDVTPATALGQTFTVPADAAYPLRSFELLIDPKTWTSDETLSLTIWDSPARKTILGRAALAGTNNGPHPRFELDAHLVPALTYFAELTHAGGGDGRVGWVGYSTNDADPTTQGYRGGSPQSWDLRYRAFYGLGLYDGYVDAWAETPSLGQFAFDHYPFKTATDSDTYFWNLALVRDRAVAHHVPFWGYLQSVAWEGMRAPKAAELRWNAFTTLAFGAAGLYYFTYWDPGLNDGLQFHDAVVNLDGSHGALFDPGALLDAEIHALGRMLGGARHDGAFVAGPNVPTGLGQLPSDAPVQAEGSASPWLIGLFTIDDGRHAALIVNLDHDAARTGGFTLHPAVAALGEVSHADGTVAPATGYDPVTAKISLTVAPGDGRVLVW